MLKPLSVAAALLFPAAALVAITLANAGAEKVAFPNWQGHVLYLVLDQPADKEIAEAYVNPDVLRAIKPGQPLPSGTILTTVRNKARLDDKGEVVRDANGRLVRGAIDRIVVMEKRTGWGSEYSDDIRNGEWEYARFRADGSRDPKADIPGCFKCHKPLDKDDFVFMLSDVLKAGR